jgi:hypothetical protein
MSVLRTQEFSWTLFALRTILGINLLPPLYCMMCLHIPSAIMFVEPHAWDKDTCIHQQLWTFCCLGGEKFIMWLPADTYCSLALPHLNLNSTLYICLNQASMQKVQEIPPVELRCAMWRASGKKSYLLQAFTHSDPLSPDMLGVVSPLRSLFCNRKAI